MLELLKITCTSLALFLAIDFVWLGLVAKDWYAKMLQPLMTSQVNWMAAIILYVILTTGLSYFVIQPGVEKPFWETVMRGAAFGFIAYATYDLTNQATLKSWSWQLTIGDMMWGTFISALVTGLTLLIYTQFLK